MSKKKTEEELILEQLAIAQLNADFIWSLVDEEIKQPEALLNFRNEPVVFKNTSILIQGKTGTHKSRFAAALISLILSDDIDKERYGFSKQKISDAPILYIDTERDKNNQLPIMLQQLISETSIAKDELRKRLTLLPFSEVTRTMRLKAMGRQIKKMYDQSNGFETLVVVLDVISDFANDFNSVEATNCINDIINYATSKYAVTFITIIHENPGEGDKARGHLGTELTNKASTIFQIAEVKNMKGIFKIQMLKSRTSPKYDEVLLKFDNETNNLEIVTDEDIRSKAKDPEVYKLGAALARNSFVAMDRTDLILYLEKVLNWKQRKIEEKLKKFVDEKIQFESIYGQTLLTKERGEKTIYRMTSLEMPSGNLSDWTDGGHLKSETVEKDLDPDTSGL